MQAGPKDGRIVNGSGSISHSGTHTDIHQNSDFLSTRWGSFNIGANESVQAHQPGASSRLLIRVDGGGATNIAGSYTSNGITILENQNGVQFSRGAIVNVGGLLATSSRISGVGGNNWQLNGTGGAVVNHGTITAGAGGAILAAVKVQNTGDITAKGGDVALGAGSSFTVDFAGSMVGFEITKAASGASITNSGKIEAQGGVVALSAQEAQAVRTNVISIGGVVKATRIERRGGVVYLSGGDEGVAEVSGDVQASEQIQTTGEYVVVKEGAVLAAPDILVGGDFQGRGDVQTAQRTLVERGALLDAGAEGRVIVWSDDVTWFNGNINVPGGFAEVSGKGNLAAVNLPGINVGAGGTLLLDPLRIIIDATSTTTLGAGVLFADNADGDTNINAADIAGFTGALELQARGGIRVTADIISTTLTSLTLRAQDDFGPDGMAGGGDDGPDFTGNGDANNIGFFGTTTLDLGEASLTLIAGVVNIRNGATSTITARGGLTFRFTRDGLNLATAQATHVTGFTAGADTTLTYAFGLTAVADNISATAINCAGQTDICSITRTADQDVQISSGNLSARTSLTIDISRGTLSFAGTGLITVSAPTVSITAGSLDIGTRNLIIEATGGSLTLNTPIINGATGVGASRILRAVNGSITIGDNIIAAAGNGNIDSDLTISSMGTGAGIILDADIQLRGRNIELTGEIAGTEGTSRGLEIRTVSLGNIMLNSDINLRGGRLDLRTDQGGGRIITTGSPVIMVGELSLLEGAGGVTDTGYVADLFSTMSRATGETIIRVGRDVMAAVVIHPWMAGLNAGSFRLQAVGGGPIPMITLPASFVSTGNITLNAAAIALSGDATTILSGAAVTLTGGITGAGGLDLTATDRLTLNSGIAIGGALAIIAGERINLANANTVITAGAFTINFTDPDVANDEAGFTLGDGTATLGNLDATNSSPPTITFIPDMVASPIDDCIRNGEACSLIRDDADLETADASLESDVGITISIGTGTLTFGGGLVEITIDAPTVSITAGNIDIGTRALTITASGGALTLNTPITADAGSMGNVEIFATGGALELGGDINARGGALTLSSTGTNAGITLNSNVTLDGAAITLTGVITEASSNDNAFIVRATGQFTLNSNINTGGHLSLSGGSIVLNAPVELMGASIFLTGEISGNNDLTVTAPGQIRLINNNNINIGTSALTLSGSGIVLVGTLTLTGGAITLGGAISGGALTVTASGVLTLNDNIDIGTGALSLTGSNIVTPGTPTLTASMVSLTQDIAFSPAPPFTFMTPTLNLTATTPQPFYLWMVDRNFVRSAGITGRNLSLTGASITFTGNVNAGGGNLTLVTTGSGFTLDDNRRLEGAAITLTGAIASDDGFAFTITATGDITLNSDIDLFDGSLTLTATGNNIVLGAGNITLTGGNVALTGAIDGNNPLTVMADNVLTLNDDIDTGAGALTLSSSFGGIVLDGTTTLRGGAITLTGGIGGTNALTATATGALTLNSNINIGGTGDLILSGMTIALGGDATTTISLTGRNVTLTGVLTANAPDLTIMAGTVIRLNDNINTGTGNLILDGTGGIALGSGVTSLDGNAVSLTGVIIGRTSGTAALAVTADGALTLNSNIDIGTGALTLSGATITLGNSLDSLEGGAITLTGAITRTGSNSLTVTATGALTLNSDIATNGTGNLTLRGATIVLGNGVDSLSGNVVELTGALSRASGNADLTITARGGVLTLNDNINIDTGALTLIADDTIGSDAITGTNPIETLTASEVNLMQGAVFFPAAVFEFATGALNLTTNVAQTVETWMAATDRDLSLVSTGAAITIGASINTGAGNIILNGNTGIVLGTNIMLTGAGVTLTGAINESGGMGGNGGNDNLGIDASGAITLNSNINLGTGALTLDSDASIVLVGPITLDGAAITLTGALTSSNNLTINAGGRLTLNSAINLGGGTLAITADERIAVPNAMTLITAGAFTIVFTDPVVQDTATGFVGAFTNLTGDTAGLTFAPPLAADCTGQIGNCSLGVDGTDLLVVATLTLAALDTLTIDIGTTAMLTFDGIGAIMITARAVTITAGTIDIGGRNLSIRTTNGKLTLNTSIINAGTLILSSATSSDPAIVLSRNTMLSGVNIDITGSISVQRNLTVMATDTLTLNSNISVLGNNTLSLTGGTGGTGGITLGNPIELVGTLINLTGEIDGNNGLTIRTNTFANVVLTLNDNINTGTGNLTLISDPGPLVSEFGSIVLGSGLTFLRGNAVSLTGVVTRASGDANLGIMATGALTLNNNITISAMGTLTLMTGAGAIMNGDTERALTAGTVSLNQVAAFDPTAPFTFGSATSLTLTTATDQTVHGWMVDTTNNRALSLTTTGAITVNDNIDTGTRALTLSAGTSIFLRGVGGARTLEGSAVTLTGTLDSRVSGDGAAANNIIITADNGNITITGNIIASGNDGVGFGNPGGAGGALTLMANSGNIMITGNFTSIGGVGGFVPSVGDASGAGGTGGAVTLMAGNIMIGNINAVGGGIAPQRSQSANGGNGGSGGAVMITGTGTVQIGEIRANGVNGQGTTNDNIGGAGGAGGVITLQGASVSVRLINSVRGRGGVNQGEGSNGSGGVAGSVMITATGGDLTLMGSINVSGGALTLRAPGNNVRVIGSVPTLTASTVTINQGDEFANNLIIAEATSLILTTTRAQIVRPWMTAGSNRSLSLTSSGAIIINADITLGSGNLTLIGMGGITVNGSRTLSGGAITLEGVIDSGSSELTVTASGQLTLNSNITVRILTLTAGTSGTGDIATGASMPTLIANLVRLTQAGAFAEDALFTFGGRMTPSLVLRVTGSGMDQAVYDWMIRTEGDPDNSRGLNLRTTGAITIDRNIDTGSRDLILFGTALTFTGDMARTLSGANVTLTGNATNAGALTIRAGSTLTLNSNITTTSGGNISITGGTGGITTSAAGVTLTSDGTITTSGDITAATGNGDLTLNALSMTAGTITLGGSITLGTGTATLTAAAGSADTGPLRGTSLITAAEIEIIFTSTQVTGPGNVPAIGTTITFAGDTSPMIMYGARECNVGNDCVISFEGALVVQHQLTAVDSITIEAIADGDGVSSVRFGGERATITLTAPLVTIIADMINLEGRNLVIVDTNGGRLTLSGNVSGAAAITARNGGGTTFGFIDIVGARTIAGDAITLTATLIRTVNRAGTTNTPAAHNLTITATGGLTIATGINTGTGTTLTLTAGPGDITGTGTPMLTAGTVSLTQAGTFGDPALFMFAASVGALNLTTDASGLQMVHPWMFAVMDRDLSLTSNGGRLFIGGNINIGAGNLFLSGTSIELSQIVSSIALTGGAVELTGRVDGTVNSNNFTITASGDITLNNNINLGAGDLILDGTSIVLGDGARILNGGAVTLTGAVSATNTPLTITASGDITINNNIDLGTGALILTATGANIVDVDGVVPVLTASTVSLTQAGTFAADLFTLAAGVTSLTLDAGSAAQTVHAWIAGGMNRTLSLTTTGAITIGRNIATGTSSLTLVGGTLTLTAAATLSGADIALTGNLTSAGRALTITAADNITITGNINTGGSNGMGGDPAGSNGGDGGSLTLTATSGNITISGFINTDGASGGDGTGAASSGGDAGNSGNVMITADGTVQIGSTISATGGRGGSATGSGRAGDGGNGGVVDISGSVVTVNAVLTTRGASGNVGSGGNPGAGGTDGRAMITATGGNLTIERNVSVGSGTLTLEARGAGSAILNDGTRRTLTAGTVSLTQVATFASGVLFTFTADTLNLTTAAAQTVYGWMTSGNRSLNLTSTGREITTGSINTGTGDLTLSALAIELMGSPSFIGRNVVLDGPVDGRSGGSGSFTVMATGNITINGNVNVGAGTATSITLTADSDGNGTGNILSDVDTGETLTAGTVSLTQAGAFAPTALFTFDPLAVGTLNLTTAAPQTVHPWMVAADRTLNLTSTGGSITVGTAITASGDITLTATTININADIGTSSTPIAGSLTLNSDTLAFSGARTLSGANISLTGAATNAANLTLTTAGTLTIAASIAITGGDLMLTGTGGIVIGTATGAGALTLSGDAITLAGAVTTASSNGAANLTDLTITAQGALSVAGIDLSNNDDTAHGALVLIAGAGTQTGDITFVAGAGGILNAASVELRQDTDFNAAVDRPVDILINGMEPGLTGNPDTVVISGEVQVPWAAILVTVGDLTITDDGGDDDPDDIAGNTGIVLATARLSYTGNITLNAGAGDITFETGLGNITWEAANITITAGSIVLGARTLTITAGEGGTLTLNVTSIIATGTNDLAFAGTTIRLGRTAPGSATGTTTLTGAAITLTAANGITVGRFSNSGAFISTGAPILVVNASGAVTIAADITSVARINLGSADNAVGIAVTGARTLSGSLIRFNSDVTANDGLTVNSTAGNLIFNGDITTGTSALSLTSAAAIRILGEASATRTLTGGDITLTAANGVEVGTSTLSLTVTASGVLTIAAAITTEGTITLQGAGAIVGTAGRPRLTASTVSLTQIDVFAEVGQFRFTADSLVLTNTAAAGALQDVHNWMIGLNRNLTLTSPARVRVAIAIGASVLSRNLGDGSITLMSTGADIRIRENISTTGNIILSGSVGINFNGRAAKTLSGADITLTGEVVSNRDLTLTASGTLTLNSDITATASNLVLTGGGGITLGSALTLTGGGDVTLTGMIDEAANGLTITAVGTLTINSDGIATGSGNLSLTGAAIRLGRTAPGSDTGTATLTGAAITLTAANGITVGRFNNSGAFISTGAPALMVTASGVLTIAANIRSVADITLVGGTGGIVIGTATGSSALLWRGSDITLTGAVTTASTAGIDNFTSLTVRASGNLVVGAIDLGNDAGGSADDWGDLRLRADTGTITVTGNRSTIIDAGSILFQQDAELFAVTASDEPANLHINGEDVSGTPSLRSMVLVFSTDNQDSVTWGTVIGAGAIVRGTSDAPQTDPIMLNNGVLLSLVSITINAGTGEVTFAGMGDITLAAPVITITAGSINTNNRNLTITTDGGTLTLNSNITLTGTGNLTLTSGTIQITRGPDDVAGTVRTLSGANITLTAADGILLGRLNRGGTFLTRDAVANLTVTATGMLGIAADITVDSTATSGGNIALTGGDIAFGTAARTISGVDITLMGNAAGSADLTLTASGTLTINNNITLTGADLTLALSGAGAIVGAGTPELTASTVSLRQAAAFAEGVLFTFGSATDSLELTTTVNQDVHDWMINDGIDLTVESPGRVRVEVAIGAGSGRDLGTGDLTLTSTGGAIRIVASITTTGNITLSGATGINLNSTSTSTGMVTLTGAAITLSGNALSNRALTLDATSGILRINNNITLTGTSNLTLMSATVVRIFADISTDGDITLSGGGTIGINLNSGAGAKTFSGAAIMLTGAAVSNRDLTLDASGILTLNDDIIATGTSALSLSGSSVALGGALTLTGGAITLTGAAMGSADLTITASGTLTINNDINTGAGALTLRGAGAIGNGGNFGADRLMLTAGTVSLRQDAAFGARPFNFGTPATPIGSLALTTEAAQVVLDWMIVADRNLTVTSAANVFVRSAIGSSVDGRDLGGGSITLTSTGGAIRILAGISTTGDLTLDASTLVNLNSGAGAKMLSGAVIMLTGDALSNRDLTITATSGALTLNGDINTSTSALTLTGATISIAGDSSATHTLSGGAIALTGAATSTANLTITASGILTINSDITLTGTGLTLALRGAGAIGDGGTATALTASTVRLRQFAAFAVGARFTFGSATGSLEFTTTVNQVVHDWMINDGTDLTVESTRRVSVVGAIGAGSGRDLGTGALTLTSTGGVVRILANIATGGAITLRSTGGVVRILANLTTGGAITLDGATGINTSGGARTFSGEGITLNGAVTSTGDDVIINANGGILSLSSDVDTRDVTDPAASPTFGNLTLTGETIEIGRRATDTPTDTRILLRGGNITLTSASGIQIGRITRDGFFLMNDSVANFIVRAIGTLTIAADITVASTATLGGDIALTSRSTTPIAFTGARTITGRDITLTGAATGTANLTIAATGILTFIGDSIATGSGNLSLTGAAIRLGRTAPGSDTGTTTLTGAAITLTAANGITVGRFNNSGAFISTGAPALVVDASGVLTIAAAITSVAGLTLEGADAIVTTPDRPRLTASTVSLTQIDAFTADGRGRGLFRFAAGSLVLSTQAAQDVHNWMISPDRNLTLTSALQVRVGAAIGADLEGRDLGDGSITLTSTGGAIRILADISTTGDLTLDASTLINLNGGAGAKTLSGANVTLTGAVLSNRDLTLTATGALTLNSNITLTGDGLTLALSGAGAIGDGGTDTALTASTVRLRQVAAFAVDAQFTFGSTTGSLEFTTAANQDVHDWMINDGINLTVESTRRVSVENAAAIGAGSGRDIGTGALTLTSTGGVVRILANITTGGAITLTSTGGIVRILADISTGGAITLDGATGIDIIGGARTLSGEGITLNGAVTSTGNDVIINANSGILSLNGNVDTRDVTDPASPIFGDLTLMGATIQIGRAASTPANTRILLRGGNIMLTAANGIQIGRFNRGGGFRSNSDAANLTVRAIGALTIAGSITVDSTATSGGDIALTGNSIAFTGARTITGRAITLTGAAMGSADLTITASGTLTINNDINTGAGALTLRGAGAIGNGGNFGADRLMLTAGTVSLRQDAAFGARPFNFGTPATPIGSLALTTEAAQDVLDWMIVVGRNLNVTSAANVFVRSAIGSSVDGRNLGTGSITLTSTGGAIRILADISTMGDLTLAASTLINLNGGAAGVRTLAGAIVTLTGNAQSNRDLTLTATTFALGDDMSTINVGANMLTITAGSNLPASLTGDDRLTAGTLDLSFSCPDATCVDTTP